MSIYEIKTFFHPCISKFLPIIDLISFKIAFPIFRIPILDILNQIILLKNQNHFLLKLYNTASYISGSFLLSSLDRLVEWKNSDIDIYTLESESDICVSCNQIYVKGGKFSNEFLHIIWRYKYFGFDFFIFIGEPCQVYGILDKLNEIILEKNTNIQEFIKKSFDLDFCKSMENNYEYSI